MYKVYLFLVAVMFQVLMPCAYSAESNIDLISGNENELVKGKRGVTGVVDPVQNHNVGVGHNVVPVPIPVHIPVPKPYPVGIPKPVGVPVGVPIAIRVAIPKPYPVPVFVDSAAPGLNYGLGHSSFGIYGDPPIDPNIVLHYLARSGHFGHIPNSHDQHSLSNYALSKYIH